MRNYIRMVVLPALCVFAIICTGFVCSAEQVNRYEYIEIQPTLKAEPIDPIVIISEQPLEETVSAVEIEEYVEDTLLPREDIELIALVTMAEAEGECEEGKRLVIDTILNRVDSVYFPDTVYGVVYQANQFSSMWNGRIDKCFVDDEEYEQISLTYYADGVLADENDEVIEDVEDAVGIDSLNHFGEYEDDSVFVRNDARKCDYEILLDQRTYSEVVEDMPHQMEV